MFEKELDNIRNAIHVPNEEEEEKKENEKEKELEKNDIKTSNGTYKDEKFSKDELKKNETTYGLKSAISGGYVIEGDGAFGGRLDEKNKVPDSKIKKGFGKYKYEGVLGEFEYDPDEFAVGVKNISRGGEEVSVPVLRYIGKETNGDKIEIPEGCKNIDYTFEGNENLKTVPKIPSSVESAHASFMGCKNLEMASKESKIGEKDVSEDKQKAGLIGGVSAGAFGALKGLKVGLATGTTVSPGVGTAVGAGVGAVVGGVAGVAGANFLGKDKDGKGGTWEMPENLKDSSYMFSGCENLTEVYDSSNERLMSARNMYEGTQRVGMDKYANAHGSVAVTDFSDSSLSKAAVRDSYTNSNVDVAKHLDGNYSKYWDESTKNFSSNFTTEEENQQIENLEKDLSAKDEKYGKENRMTKATDGLMSSGAQKTDKGFVETDDPNAKSTGNSGPLGIDSAGELADRAAVSFLEYKAIKLVTRSSLIAGIATFGLQELGALPKGIKPILGVASKLLGDESGLGKSINNLYEKYPDYDNDGIKKGGKDENPRGNDELAESISTQDKMGENAKKMVNDDVFLNASNGSYTQMREVSETSLGAIESDIAKNSYNKKLSKDEVKKYESAYNEVIDGYEEYSKTALSEIDKKYKGVEAEKAKKNLADAMDASFTPVYDSYINVSENMGIKLKGVEKRLSKSDVYGVSGFKEYKDIHKVEKSTSSEKVIPKDKAISQLESMYTEDTNEKDFVFGW